MPKIADALQTKTYQVDQVEHSFVQVVSQNEVENPEETLPSPPQSENSVTFAGSPSRSQSLSWIPPVYVTLLDHFLVRMTRSISCHKGIQAEFCSFLLPMALETPHLLAAVLLSAAMHRSSVGLEQSVAQINHLRAASLTQLRRSLTADGAVIEETTMATALLLCLAEVHSGEDNIEAMKVHLQGARALWKSAWGLKKKSSAWIFFRRFYTSLESIALSYGMLQTQSDDLTSCEPEEEDYIDDLAGFSTALLPTFDEINHLVNATRQVPGITLNPVVHDAFIKETCEILVAKVENLLLIREPRFSPSAKNILSPRVQFDLFTLDEAHHHMALLQLYCRISSEVSQNRIQQSVSTIIACINRMSFVDEPCPCIAILPPLFIAGCHAKDYYDRYAVMSLLEKSTTFFAMGNVKLARRTLKELWEARDRLEDEGDGESTKWQDLIGKSMRGGSNGGMAIASY